MKTIRAQAIAQDGNDALFPNGQIKNKTSLEAGTPVVRQVYGDILTNIYAIIKDAGIEFNQQEDNEENGYQFLEALKVFVNNLNDLKQVVSVDGNTLSVNFNFDDLPNNYVFVGQLTEAISKGTEYGFDGNGDKIITASSRQNIAASEMVIIVINEAGCQIVSLSGSSSESINISFGQPLSYSEKGEIFYFEAGVLFNNNPKSYLTENIIQVSNNSVDLKVVDVVFHKGKLLCLVFDTGAESYSLQIFDENNLSILEDEIVGIFDSVDNFNPYMYCDADNIYFSNSTNQINTSADDFSFGKFIFDENALTLSHISTIEIENTYSKTTNAFIRNDKIYTFVAGDMFSYELDGSEVKNFIDTFTGNTGRVFVLAGDVYFSSGDVAIKWNY